MVNKENFTKETLRGALKKLFACLEYDQLLWGIPDDQVDLDASREEVIDTVTEIYTEKLYPVIIPKFAEIPCMTGHDANGNKFFEHEFLYHPAVSLYYEIDEDCDDGITDVMISTDVYLLSSGELVEGETINVKSGDFDMEYKSQIRYIENPYDFAFDEDYLFESLDAIAEGKDTDESEVA